MLLERDDFLHEELVNDANNQQEMKRDHRESPVELDSSKNTTTDSCSKSIADETTSSRIDSPRKTDTERAVPLPKGLVTDTNEGVDPRTTDTERAVPLPKGLVTDTNEGVEELDASILSLASECIVDISVTECSSPFDGSTLGEVDVDAVPQANSNDNLILSEIRLLLSRLVDDVERELEDKSDDVKAVVESNEFDGSLCDECEETAEQWNKLFPAQSVSWVPPSGIQLYSCEKCATTYSTSQALRNHYSNVHLFNAVSSSKNIKPFNLMESDFKSFFPETPPHPSVDLCSSSSESNSERGWSETGEKSLSRGNDASSRGDRVKRGDHAASFKCSACERLFVNKKAFAVHKTWHKKNGENVTRLDLRKRDESLPARRRVASNGQFTSRFPKRPQPSQCRKCSKRFRRKDMRDFHETSCEARGDSEALVGDNEESNGSSTLILDCDDLSSASVDQLPEEVTEENVREPERDPSAADHDYSYFKKCQKCDFATMDEKRMETHCRFHVNERYKGFAMWECPKCPARIFGLFSVLGEHIDLFHKPLEPLVEESPSEILIYNVCDRVEELVIDACPSREAKEPDSSPPRESQEFQDPSAQVLLRRDRESAGRIQDEESSGERVSCKFCQRDFLTMRGFKIHAARHKFVCELCCQDFKSAKLLRVHNYRTHPSTDDCEPVEPAKSVNSTLSKEVSPSNSDSDDVEFVDTEPTGNKPPTLRCEICRRHFHSMKAVKIHASKMHPSSGDGSLNLDGSAESTKTADSTPNKKSSPSKRSDDPETVHSEKPLPKPSYIVSCKFCRRDGFTVGGLKRHIRHRHPDKSFDLNNSGQPAKLDQSSKPALLKMDNHLSRSLHSAMDEVMRQVFTSKEVVEIEGSPSPPPAVVESSSYPCKKCGRRFIGTESLENHITRFHRLVICSQCDFTCNDLSELRDHTREHTMSESSSELNGTFKCSVCDFTSRHRSLFLMHMKTHRSEGKLFSGVSGGRGVERRVFDCALCEFSAYDEKGLLEHRRAHIQGPLRRCPLCKFVCRSRKRLRRHLEKHSPRLNCFFCGFSTSKRSVYSQHMRVHISSSDFNCDQCDFRTRNASVLRLHKRKHLVSSGERIYECAHCSYVTKRKRDLRIHAPLHVKLLDFEALKEKRLSAERQSESKKLVDTTNSQTAKKINYQRRVLVFEAPKVIRPAQHLPDQSRLNEVAVNRFVDRTEHQKKLVSTSPNETTEEMKSQRTIVEFDAPSPDRSPDRQIKPNKVAPNRFVNYIGSPKKQNCSMSVTKEFEEPEAVSTRNEVVAKPSVHRAEAPKQPINTAVEKLSRPNNFLESIRDRFSTTFSGVSISLSPSKQQPGDIQGVKRSAEDESDLRVLFESRVKALKRCTTPPAAEPANDLIQLSRSCPDCDYVAGEEQDLSAHAELCHADNYEPIICSVTSLVAQELLDDPAPSRQSPATDTVNARKNSTIVPKKKRHYTPRKPKSPNLASDRIATIKQPRCIKCNKGFSSHVELSIHTIQAHPEQENSFVFVEEREDEPLIREETVIALEETDRLIQVDDDDDSDIEYMATYELGDDEGVKRTVTCKECDARFESEASFEAHMAWHGGKDRGSAKLGELENDWDVLVAVSSEDSDIELIS